jgi:hypothetical protein
LPFDQSKISLVFSLYFRSKWHGILRFDEESDVCENEGQARGWHLWICSCNPCFHK